MLDSISKIAERKIREAQERGDFDDLPGRGQPLNLAADAGVPEELRLAYKILKNAGCLPPELMVKNEIVQIEDMLATIKDEQERYRQIKKLNFLVTKLNTMRNTPANLEENQRYYARIVSKVKVSSKKSDGDKDPG